MKKLNRTTILIGLFAGLIHLHAQDQRVLQENTNSQVADVAVAQNIPERSTIKKDNQSPDVKKQERVVIITGARFSYPLIQKWIDDYNRVNPGAQIIIESRGSADPAQYDILAEVYEQGEEIKKSREYVYIARYAVLPVANSLSSFAKVYGDKGINQDLITQLFFHDPYSDKKLQEIKVPYTIYTRLQKAGAPIVFTNYFGYEQKDIRGKAIAGSDENLLKTILRDTTAVSYLPLTFLYDHASKKMLSGITVLPVDLNGNGKVSEDEKFYGDLASVIEHLEDKDPKTLKNIPFGYLHLSVDKLNAKPEAIEFLRWVISNGQHDLHNFGYLKPEDSRFEKETFERFASKRIKP